MVTELVLLLAVYAMLILGLFLGPKDGAVNVMTNHLPKLSARIEKHTATGYGFWKVSSQGPTTPLEWSEPLNP